jgi:intein/homing endonuclease
MMTLNTKEKMLKLIKDGLSLNRISKETGLAKTTIYYYSRKIKGKKYFEPEFDLKYSEIEGEIAGIFAGDGSQHHDSKKGSYRINIHFGKTNYVFYVKDLFEGYFNKKFRLNHESRNRARLCTESKKIFFHFKNYLEYDSKIKHSTVKLRSLDLPKEFLLGFLRGFLDTDGTIARCSDRSMRIVYTTTSKELSEQLKEILKQFDVACGGYTAKRLGLKDLYQVYILARSNESFLRLVQPFKRKCLGL